MLCFVLLIYNISTLLSKHYSCVQNVIDGFDFCFLKFHIPLLCQSTKISRDNWELRCDISRRQLISAPVTVTFDTAPRQRGPLVDEREEGNIWKGCVGETQRGLDCKIRTYEQKEKRDANAQIMSLLEMSDARRCFVKINGALK